jgi:uncharacterized protein YjiS (DUF1127 family)
MISMLSNVTPGAISNPARSMAAWLTGWAHALLTWGERRAAIKALRKLDDRELRDIGLHRDQIESAVYCFTRAEAELGRFG